MELSEILSIAFASLIVLVVTHFVVYWVVKTLYPPAAAPVAPLPPPPAAVSFTDPVSTEQQNVVVPTYEAPLPAEAPREESARRGPPPPESTSIHRNPGDAVPNAQ